MYITILVLYSRSVKVISIAHIPGQSTFSAKILAQLKTEKDHCNMQLMTNLAGHLITAKIYWWSTVLKVICDTRHISSENSITSATDL